MQYDKMSRSELVKLQKEVGPFTQESRSIAAALANLDRAETAKKASQEKTIFVPEFLLTTQTEELASHQGPSGRKYLFHKGSYTPVSNVADAEAFGKNKRFKQKGLLDKNEKQKPEEQILKEELHKIKGLDQKSEDKLVKIFGTVADLKAALETGDSVLADIGAKQSEILKKHYGVD